MLLCMMRRQARSGKWRRFLRTGRRVVRKTLPQVEGEEDPQLGQEVLVEHDDLVVLGRREDLGRLRTLMLDLVL